MRIFITGSAGFIGFHLAARLLHDGHEIIGLDGFTPYYDPTLKRRRHAILAKSASFAAREVRLEDADGLEAAYGDGADLVFHCAAQAGVRYSLDHPRAYLDANLTGTFNLLEIMRRRPPRHALFASTSSVYGANAMIPFRETDRADHPMSLYAASKKATEEIAHSYAHLFDIPMTMMRFFTVYGPWGRPDMALFKFTEAICAGRPIDLYNHGDMRRDFTFVDDLVEAAVRLADCLPPAPGRRDATLRHDSLSPQAPWRVVNIGAGAPMNLVDFVVALETALGIAAKRNMMDMQPGDVPETYANSDLLYELTGYRPTTPVSDGVKIFVDWYRNYSK